MRPVLNVLAAAALAALATSAVAADTFPSRPIRLVLPYTPGGATDILARQIAPGMSEYLKQPVVIENRPGASANIGGAYVAQADPDGYTLLFDGLNLATNPSLFKSMPFDPQKDLVPVGGVATAPLALLVNPTRSELASVSTLIETAEAKPGQLTYGSAGNGNPTHLVPEIFKTNAKVDIRQIPYKGAAPAITDVIGGQVDMTFVGISSIQQFVEGGQLKALAVTGKQRSPTLPDVPTFAEAGLPMPEIDLGTWWAVFAPDGTPAPVLQTLNEALRHALQQDAVQERLQGMSIQPYPTSPEEFSELLKEETEKWGKVIRAAGITAQ